MTPEQRQSSIMVTGTMERHNLMYSIAKDNQDKGVAGGDCNVTQCQSKGASSYNEPMSAFYCQQCANAINNGNDEPFVDSQPDFSIEYGKDIKERYVKSTINKTVENTSDKVEYKPYISKNADEYYPSHYPILGIKKGVTLTRNHEKIGRNDPCSCGSGKKYKKCCN
jgi:hypothetical protein